MTLITNLDAAHDTNKGKMGRRYSSSLASFARPDDVIAYAAGDVISEDDAITQVIEFPKCGQSGAVLRAHLVWEDNEATPPNLELYLFDEEPTNFEDNVALALVSDDMHHLHGVLNFTGSAAKVVNAGVSPAGILFYTAALELQQPYITSGASDSLYGLLVTRSIFTPSALVKIWARLELEID